MQVDVQFIATLAAVAALILNWWAIRNNTKTREVQIFYRLFKDMQDLQDKYYREYTNKNEIEKKNWLSIFFNALECMAFFINTKQMKGAFKEFYRESFIITYEKIFLSKADPAEINDPKQYPEIKTLYKSFLSE